MEFHFYEIPQSESVRPMMGEQWRRIYGHENKAQHFHNLMQIGMCHEGSGVLTIDDREYPYNSGMVFVIPANCPHHLYSDNEAYWEFFLISSTQILWELFPKSQKIHEEKLAIVNQRAVVFNAKEGAELVGIVQEILGEMKRQGEYYRDVVRDLVKIFLLRLLRMSEESYEESVLETVSNPQIQPALSYIQENYAQDIRAEDLAKQCGLSEPHFRRIFREFVSVSPIEYLNFIRVREACKMMNRKDCPMDLVAADCGFNSVSAFTRNFKKFLGITPYQWKLQQEKHISRQRDYSITLLKSWGTE